MSAVFGQAIFGDIIFGSLGSADIKIPSSIWIDVCGKVSNWDAQDRAAGDWSDQDRAAGEWGNQKAKSDDWVDQDRNSSDWGNIPSHVVRHEKCGR